MTKTEIILDLTDVTAKKDSILSIDTVNQVSNLEDVIVGDSLDYATMEKNTFLLDGNERILSKEDYSKTGYCSKDISDENGNFETPIKLTIEFEGYHTSAGITIVFGDDSYCNNLDIKYYTDDEIIFENRYEPTSQNGYLAKNVIENYNKIEIIFYSTNIPYRYLKILDIIYGFEKVFNNEYIEDASTDHSINILSSELEINTLNFSVVDKESAFNIVNPQGYYKDMQENQKVSVYEYLNEKKIFIGNFYLTGWSNPSVAKADFEAHDLLGVLESYTFNGGMYSNKLSGDLIKEILNSANIDEYEIGSELLEIEINGYMPIGTCRSALQQVLFTIGAVCNTSGVETLKIYTPQKQRVSSFIEDTRKQIDTTKVELNQKISGIDFNLYSYDLKNELSEISKGYLDGVNKIQFMQPIEPMSIVSTNCTVIEVGYNYAIINSTLDNQYKLEANVYEETQTSKLIQRVTKENIKESILTIQDIKLINMNNIISIAERIFNHYNSTYKTTLDIGGNEERVGDFISVNTFNDYKLLGNITEIAIDLTGGFKQSVTIDNAILKQGTIEYSYTGNIYTGLVGIKEGV